MPRITDRTGITRTATGWRVYVRVRPLPPMTGRFPAQTPMSTLIAKRDEFRVELRKRRNDDARLAPTAGTFAADAARYLEAVAGMTTYDDRAWQIDQWVTKFGTWHRRKITAADMRAALAEWQAEGYSARTLNHFRTALMHLWHTLDGKSASNPVKDVPSFRTPDDLPRDMPHEAVVTILGTIAPSKARAVLVLMYASGMTPTEISRLLPVHVRPDAIIALGRRKGKGTRPRTLPITPDLRDALTEFTEADAWGGVTLKTANAAWRLAKRKAGYGAMDWKAYDLRHSYLTRISAGGDDRVTQYLGGHSTPKMTHRYTLGSVPDRVAQVVATVVAKRLAGGRESSNLLENSHGELATTDGNQTGEDSQISTEKQAKQAP